jgi:hypothetical protein
MFMHTHLAETRTRENHIRAHRNSPPDKPRPPAIITHSRAHIHSHSYTHTSVVHGKETARHVQRKREEGERKEDLNSGRVPIFNVALEIRLGFEDLITV